MLLDSWSIANSPKCWNGEIAFLDVDHIVVLCSIAGVSVFSSEMQVGFGGESFLKTIANVSSYARDHQGETGKVGKETGRE